MGRYISGRYVESSRSLIVKPANWKILDALSEAYPSGHTAAELKKSTKQSESDVYRNLAHLERENHIVKIEDKSKVTSTKPSSVYIIEESSRILQTLFGYQLSPGNVEFSNDFKNAWELIVPKEDETDLLRGLIQFAQKVVRLTKESYQKEVEKIAPNLGKEFCCKNCGVNHEAREFIRAVLIHLIDRLEVQREFVEYQKKEQLLTETAFERIIKLSDGFEQQDKRRIVAKPVTKSDSPKEELTKESESTKITLRILSIQKDSLKEQIPFTATDKNGKLFDGTIDQAIVRDEITANAIMEYDCKTLDEKLAISINDSLEIKTDDPSIPKLSQLETKLQDIAPRRKYVLNVVILKEPETIEEKTHEGTSKVTWSLIGDETGFMRLVDIMYPNFLDKFHRNDNVRIINAIPNGNFIHLSTHGSIEKIGSVDANTSDMLCRTRYEITPSYKIPIKQEQTRGDIKVTLDKLHLLEDYTRLFVTIENTNENTDIRLSRYGLKAIQAKKQFDWYQYTDSRYRNIKSTIPPGVEETGVLLFEPLDSIEDDVKFLIPFYNETFTFDVKLSK